MAKLLKVSIASGVMDSVYGKSQYPIMMFLEKKAEAYEAQSVIDSVFNMEKSKHFGEKVSGMTSFDAFDVVPEGGAYPKDTIEEGFSKNFEHVTVKKSFPLTQELVEDANLINFKKQPAGFVGAYYRTREKLGAALFGAAIQGNSSIGVLNHNFSALGADGVGLFNTGHTSATGEYQNQSNRYTNAFSDGALGLVESAMQDYRDDNGNVLGIVPDTIIIPNDAPLKKAVFAAIGADKDPDTANNGFNYHFGRWNVIVWQYLNQFLGTETAPWIVTSSQYNQEAGGAIWFDRVPLEIRSYIDENTDDNIWKGRARFSAGFNDWRFAAVGGVASGTTLS